MSLIHRDWGQETLHSSVFSNSPQQGFWQHWNIKRSAVTQETLKSLSSSDKSTNILWGIHPSLIFSPDGLEGTPVLATRVDHYDSGLSESSHLNPLATVTGRGRGRMSHQLDQLTWTSGSLLALAKRDFLLASGVESGWVWDESCWGQLALLRIQTHQNQNGYGLKMKPTWQRWSQEMEIFWTSESSHGQSWDVRILEYRNHFFTLVWIWFSDTCN